MKGPSRHSLSTGNQALTSGSFIAERVRLALMARPKKPHKCGPGIETATGKAEYRFRLDCANGAVFTTCTVTFTATATHTSPVEASARLRLVATA
jgi:hypothetical protein